MAAPWGVPLVWNQQSRVNNFPKEFPTDRLQQVAQPHGESCRPCPRNLTAGISSPLVSDDLCKPVWKASDLESNHLSELESGGTVFKTGNRGRVPGRGDGVGWKGQRAGLANWAQSCCPKCKCMYYFVINDNQALLVDRAQHFMLGRTFQKRNVRSSLWQRKI